ncbi:MAG: phage tail protein, partial [Mesorhizobium sp.]
MMGLGPFRFSLSTAAYQALERSDEYRWVSQDRIGRHPAMQFVG